MPTIAIDVDAREKHEASKARGDQHWRKILLDALNVRETPRKVGRPPRMISHDVRAENTGTDHHQVVGLDSGAMQTRLLDAMRRRRKGR